MSTLPDPTGPDYVPGPAMSTGPTHPTTTPTTAQLLDDLRRARAALHRRRTILVHPGPLADRIRDLLDDLDTHHEYRLETSTTVPHGQVLILDTTAPGDLLDPPERVTEE